MTATEQAQPETAKPAKSKDGAPQHFQRLLFDAMAAPLASDATSGGSSSGAAAARAALQGMPWMLATYCTSLHAFRRQATTQGRRLLVP